VAPVPSNVSVVPMPREVDLSSAGEVGGAIVAAVALGMATVVVDFTRTILCATAGIRPMVCIFWVGPDHRITAMNRACLTFVGGWSLIDLPFREAQHQLPCSAVSRLRGRLP
jgi:hypothetical protein